MNTDKIVKSLKDVNWLDLGVAAVGVLGLVLSGKQKKQEQKMMNEEIQKKVQEAITNLK